MLEILEGMSVFQSGLRALRLRTSEGKTSDLKFIHISSNNIRKYDTKAHIYVLYSPACLRLTSEDVHTP